MRVEVFNEPKGLNDWLLRAVDFYAKHLFSRQLARHLQINVVFSDIPRSFSPEGVEEVIHALCSTGHKYNSRGRPRSFIIDMDNELAQQGQLEVLISTLAHEMVHVKQYAYGELDDGQTVWKGESIDGDSLPYSEHPWEIEANRVEEILYSKLFNADTTFQQLILLDAESVVGEEGHEQQEEVGDSTETSEVHLHDV